MLIYLVLELVNAKYPPEGTTVTYVETTTMRTIAIPPMADEPVDVTTFKPPIFTKPPIFHGEIQPVRPVTTNPPEPVLYTEVFRMGLVLILSRYLHTTYCRYCYFEIPVSQPFKVMKDMKTEISSIQFII